MVSISSLTFLNPMLSPFLLPFCLSDDAWILHEMSADFGIKMSVLNFTMQEFLKLGTDLTHAVPKSSLLHREPAIREADFFLKDSSKS